MKEKNEYLFFRQNGPEKMNETGPAAMAKDHSRTYPSGERSEKEAKEKFLHEKLIIFADRTPHFLTNGTWNRPSPTLRTTRRGRGRG